MALPGRIWKIGHTSLFIRAALGFQGQVVGRFSAPQATITKPASASKARCGKIVLRLRNLYDSPASSYDLRLRINCCADYTAFTNGVDRTAVGTRHPHLAVILSEAKACPERSRRDLLLYAGIGLFPAEKQIPRGVYPEQRRRARNDNALWFTPTVKTR